MSKEDQLKLIHLKVSIHCCDGCKRKVKKALQSIEGVIKTEIHLTKPKVTVEVRSVKPQTLIKKLEKNGKTVELWIDEAEFGKPKHENPKEKQKERNNLELNCMEKVKPANQVGKSAQENGKPTPKSSEGEKSKKDECAGNRSAKKGGEQCDKQVISGSGGAGSRSDPPEAKKPLTPSEGCSIKPGIVHLGNVEANYPYPYPVGPPLPPSPPVPQIHYLTTPYSIPPVYFVQNPNHSAQEMFHQHTKPAQSAFDSYFDDDNTVGCTVM